VVLEDRRVLKALRRGDLAALGQVYAKYKDDLLTVAASLTCDVNTAEDCLQEVFVKLASDGCDVHGNLKGYLLSCVVNKARDHLRRRVAASNVQIDATAPRGSPADPADVMADRDEAIAAIRALRELPCEQREVVVLHLQGDMTLRRIAAMTGTSVNTVQSRYRYGLEKLRAVLAAKELQ